MRSLNNSGVTQSLTNTIKLNLFKNFSRAMITKVDLIFKKGI